MSLWTQAFASLAGVVIGVLVALWIDAAARARRSRARALEAAERAERQMWDLLQHPREQPRRRVRLVARNEARYRRLRAARHRAWYL